MPICGKRKKLKKFAGIVCYTIKKKKECKVSVLLEDNIAKAAGFKITENGLYHIPVSPENNCLLEELGIPVQQVRWWVEDEHGNKTDNKGTVKMEYPIDSLFD